MYEINGNSINKISQNRIGKEELLYYKFQIIIFTINYFLFTFDLNRNYHDGICIEENLISGDELRIIRIIECT